MSHHFPLRSTRNGKHSATTPSPLRHASTMSASSSEENHNTENVSPSRASTFTSTPSIDPANTTSGHKRGICETSPTKTSALPDYQYLGNERGSSGQIQGKRRTSLQEVPQGSNLMAPPAVVPPASNKPSTHSRGWSEDSAVRSYDGTRSRSPTEVQPKQQYSMALSRSDSRRAPTHDSSRSRHIDGRATPPTNVLDSSEFQKLGRSTTGHLRTLSKFAEQGDGEFKITSREQEVAGLHGRRRLQRNMSNRNKRTLTAPGYGGRTWMDQQRQFLQAYEYLCHIGEAKEWIEDIIQRPIPAIVQLEEALRDGVTLAEVVQAIFPERSLRIFRNPRLQFRHSDNIALFFKLVAEVELPELFRFELVDLYEKKNIPKVIYCIHALSWLLFRKGVVNFRIGNLVGQLEFEQHELETMQKGLDRAGVSMPNFSGMSEKLGAEPEPEPVETEEERIDRELLTHEEAILDLQTQLRGALLRMRLGDTMQHLWENEDTLVDLQSRIRGDFARQISEYRLNMKRFAEGMQSVVRGFLVRARERSKEAHWKESEKTVIVLQSLARARAARIQIQKMKSRVQEHHHGIRDIQAAIRGALTRWDVGEQWAETREVEPLVIKLQSIARASRARQQHRDFARSVKQMDEIWIGLQSHAKGHIARTNLRWTREALIAQNSLTTRLQALAKGRRTRTRLSEQKSQLAKHQSSVLKIQSFSRGFHQRSKVYDLLCELNDHESAITTLQGFAKAVLLRSNVDDTLEQLEANEDAIVDLQAAARAKFVRAAFAEKQRFFKENMKKVIKIQSFVRGRLQGEAYKSLTTGKNPPVGTVKNFVHLLNDSDFDFDEEVESEKLQKQLVQRVQVNEQTEQYIADLDAKIGLLAHTKIASDELAKMRKHNVGYLGGGMNRHSSLRDSFNLKALNKNSRSKLERYQELFFLLQTQPQYLARLFKRSREHGAADPDHKKLESLTMSTFAFAQKRREEYFLLKLLARSVKEEVDGCASLQDFTRTNFFFHRLYSAYIRVPRDRKYVRQVLGHLVMKNFIENEHLDLESDPLQIHRSVINDEELRTGRRSNQVLDLPRDEAIKDKKVRVIFISHLQDMRSIVDDMLLALEEALPRMPYGTRYVARQLHDTLCARFPREDPDQILQIVGNWLWKTYFKPAVSEPENHGIIDRGFEPRQKRNLGEFSKVISQIAAGRLFGEENIYLQPLNNYVEESINRYMSIVANAIEVPGADEKFDISEFNDLYAKVKPTLYIKLGDVFAIHQMVADEIPSICLTQEDNVLRDLIRDLGSARNNESEMGAAAAEVTLHLGGKVHNLEDPDADIKALFMETKRCVLYIIRIQAGANLMDIMVKPITEEDEIRWESLVREEVAVNSSKRRRTAYADSSNNNLVDIASMTYAELKRIALENILSLEQAGRLTRHNQYQDILNEIAIDIRNKHRRRVQRQKELETVRTTIAHLEDKQKWLDDRLKGYNDAFEQNVAVLQGKAKGAGKGKFVMPFSKQWHHNREMERLGREPRYGSYKRSAESLSQKGLLLSWDGRDLRNDDVTVSSDEINQFLIEGSSGSMMITGASAEFTWDDLLEAEYDARDVIEFFAQPGSESGGRGPRRGVLRLDRALFKAWMSKKFFPDA